MQIGKPMAIWVDDDSVHVGRAQAAVAVRLSRVRDAGEVIPLVIHLHKPPARRLSESVTVADGIAP